MVSLFGIKIFPSSGKPEKLQTDAKSLFDLTVNSIRGEPVSLSTYSGRVSAYNSLFRLSPPGSAALCGYNFPAAGASPTFPNAASVKELPVYYSDSLSSQ